MHPAGHRFEGSTIFCVDPETGDCIYVARRGCPDALGGIPGGKVDPGESYSATALREFAEETGLELDAVHPDYIFDSMAVATNARCLVHVGVLSVAKWSELRARVPFDDPEGLRVRLAPFWEMTDPAECPQFAEFNLRFFKHVQLSEEARRVFADMGLEAVYRAIREHRF